MKKKASFVGTPLIDDVNNEHYGHLLTLLQDVEGFYKRNNDDWDNNVKYSDKLEYLDIEKWNTDKKYQETFFENLNKYCDNYNIYPHLITFKLKKEFDKDPSQVPWHRMRQDALLLYSNFPIESDDFESLYDEVDEFNEYEKIFQKIIFTKDYAVTDTVDVSYYEFIKINALNFDEFIFYINHSIKHDTERREKQAKDEQKEGLYKIVAIVAFVFIVLGGIAACSAWVNSLPDPAPKGVMDNPEIKQWMKKNMEKRGDKYYLKPDK